MYQHNRDSQLCEFIEQLDIAEHIVGMAVCQMYISQGNCTGVNYDWLISSLRSSNTICMVSFFYMPLTWEIALLADVNFSFFELTENPHWFPINSKNKPLNRDFFGFGSTSRTSNNSSKSPLITGFDNGLLLTVSNDVWDILTQIRAVRIWLYCREEDI